MFTCIKIIIKLDNYIKCFLKQAHMYKHGQTNLIYFLIKDDDLLEKLNTFSDKVCDSKPAYNKSFLKTKTKSHGNKITDVYNKNVLKVDSNHTCFAVIRLDSALKKAGNYYL